MSYRGYRGGGGYARGQYSYVRGGRGGRGRGGAPNPNADVDAVQVNYHVFQKRSGRMWVITNFSSLSMTRSQTCRPLKQWKWQKITRKGQHSLQKSFFLISSSCKDFQNFPSKVLHALVPIDTFELYPRTSSSRGFLLSDIAIFQSPQARIMKQQIFAWSYTIIKNGLTPCFRRCSSCLSLIEVCCYGSDCLWKTSGYWILWHDSGPFLHGD